MPEKNKINIVSLIAGVLMILFSALNYLMNEDDVSLGIFVFMGLGFVLLGLKDKFGEVKAKRITKFAMTFFFGAAVIFLYWLLAVKFHFFQ